MKEEISRIKKFLPKIEDNKFYDTGFIALNNLFVKERKGEIVGGHEIYYYVIQRGLLKAKKEKQIGVSKRAVYKIKGSDLKEAIKIYYNL